MKRSLLTLSRVALVIVLLTGLLFPWAHVRAYTAGTAGSVALSPNTGTMAINANYPVDVMFNTANVAISTLQVVLRFTVSSSDLSVPQVDWNTALSGSGWSFSIKTVNTSGSTTTISLVAINLDPAGFSTSANTKLATITFKANSAFSGKAVTFDSGQTLMGRKDNGADMVGSLSTNSYSASTTGSGATPTYTPTPTQGSGGGGTSGTPNCNSITSNITSAVGVPQNITLTCTGSVSNADINLAEFTFGDGATQTVSQNIGTSGSISVSHTYNQIGSLGATCRLRNNSGIYSNTCNTIITIKAKPSSGGGGGGIRYVTPTPIRGVTVTETPEPEITETIEETPTEFPVITDEPTITPVIEPEEKSGFPWLIVGIIAIIVGGAFLLLRKKGPPMPPVPPGQNPYIPQPPATPTGQPMMPGTTPAAAAPSYPQPIPGGPPQATQPVTPVTPPTPPTPPVTPPAQPPTQ